MHHGITDGYGQNREIIGNRVNSQVDWLDKVIVLLSGGIDSATALYLTKKETSEVFSLNFVYAQASIREAETSQRLATEAKVREHITVSLPFFKEIQTRYRPQPTANITSAYVPARNIIFYGIAGAYAETLGARKIVFGSNAEDAKELPDARPEFVRAANVLLAKGTRVGAGGNAIQVVNPLIESSKKEVLRLAIELNVPLELTWSCHEDVILPCHRCRGCVARHNAFKEIGMQDPLDLRLMSGHG